MTLLVGNCIFKDSSSFFGGSIYCSGPATITDCLFSNSIANRNGGSICCLGVTEIMNSVFIDSVADNGGGVYCNGILDLDGCYFENCVGNIFCGFVFIFIVCVIFF
jgi:hypothetical protein